jgi:prepilin-type N-terminal cleavage/methylation domain-containing protein
VNKNKQSGFTLVELMIATSVFAVVITIGMYGFIQINRFYTRSLTIIRTQDSARNLMMDIANQFQLTSGIYQDAVTEGALQSGEEIVCVGNKSYVYKINTIEDPKNNNHAITSYDINPNTCPDTGTNPVYLLRPGVRIIQLDITPYPNDTTGPLFNITVALLYAPDDNSSINSAGTDLVDTKNDKNGDISHISEWRCTSTVKGSEYCSLSRLTTSVYKRVQSND